MSAYFLVIIEMELQSIKLKNGTMLLADGDEQPSIVPWLLAAFSGLTGSRSVLEMCSGNGASSFWCIDRGLTGDVALLDIRENALRIAEETADINNIDNVRCICASVEGFRSENKYDAVICNPPFFSEYSVSENEEKRAIRHEGNLSLDILCQTASKCIKQRGHFYLCHTPSRLIEVLQALSDSMFQVKRIRFCRNSVSQSPFLVLIDSIYKGGKGVNILPDFLVYDGSGSFSQEMLSLTERYN